MSVAVTSSARLYPPRLRAWWVDLFPIAASGVALALVFPPVGWWWLSFVALCPALWVAARAVRGRRVLLFGFGVYLVWWLLMARWLGSVGVGPWLGASVVQAGYFAGGLFAVWVLCRRMRLPMTLAAAVGWSVMDLTRGHLPFGGFSWFSLGHTQAGWTQGGGASWIAQTADVFGQHFVGLLVAMVNGLVVDVAIRGRGARRMLIVTAVVLAVAAGYGWWRVAQTDRVTSPGPTIAVVQNNVPMDNRRPFSMEDDAARWAELVALSDRANASSPDVIVWPESSLMFAINDESVAAFPGRVSGASFIRAQLEDLTRRLGTDLLLGGAAHFDWRDITDEDGKTFLVPGRRRNRVYHVYADGRLAPTTYDKTHLVPFGEYIPGSQALPILKTIVLKWFSPWEWDYTVDPGDQRSRFEIAYTAGADGGEEQRVARLVTPICFEDTVPRRCRLLVYRTGEGKADVLVNQTNDGWFWFGSRPQPGDNQPPAYRPTGQNIQHLQLASLRSIENRVPTARSVNTGVSGFIDSAGRIGPLVEHEGKQQLVAGVGSHRVMLDPRRTWYGWWGDGPMWVLGLLTYGLVVAGLVRPWLHGR